MTGDLTIPAIALSMRSILIYDGGTNRFEQEMTIHTQARGSKHFAVRAPCTAVFQGSVAQYNEAMQNSVETRDMPVDLVVRDDVLFIDDRTDLSYSPLILPPSRKISMNIGNSIHKGSAGRCEVCGSTCLINARIFHGRSAKQADASMQGRTHQTCGAECTRKILTVTYDMSS